MFALGSMVLAAVVLVTRVQAEPIVVSAPPGAQPGASGVPSRPPPVAPGARLPAESEERGGRERRRLALDFEECQGSRGEEGRHES